MYDDTKNTASTMITNGTKLEEVVQFFHRSGLTIAQSMKALVELRVMTLGEAKAFVSSQPCWAGVVAAADGLHEELLQRLPKQSRPQ